MTGMTPYYGIRHPEGGTKVRNLGDELAQMAGDIERTLAAANVPGAPGARFARLDAVSQNVADSVVSSIGVLSVASALSNAASFVTPGDSRVTFTEPGLYSIDFILNTPRPATGRTFLDCSPAGGVNARTSMGLNDDSAILSRTLRVTTAPLIVEFKAYKNTGATHTLTTVLEISKIA